MGNKILIIGNGFDIYHGLPTTYKDFLFFARKWKEFKYEYDKHDALVDNNSGEMIEVRLGEHNELISESLKDFAVHAYLYSKEHITYLDEHINDNVWLTYFDKRAYFGENWIDFEAEIEGALSQVELYYTKILPSVKNDIPMKAMPEWMINVIYTFSEKLEKTGNRYENLAKRIFRIPNDLDYVKLHQNKRTLLSFMKDELDALNKCLDYYMLDFVSSIKCDVYSEQIKNLGHIYLLNFNYTYTYAMVYGKTSLLKHHPIHGEAKEENLVLGISDDSFGNSLDYVYFQKYFQRIQKKTGNYYKEWPIKPQSRTLSDGPAQVFIMGHSLSKVDKGILKDFFEEQYVEMIKIYYHNQESYEKQIINLVDMFSRDFVIDQTNRGRIVFEELKAPAKAEKKEITHE